MTCHVCGGELQDRVTRLPLRLSDLTIVIIKDLPVLECVNCGECLLPDKVMGRVEQIFDAVHPGSELEIVSYAA